MPTRGQGRDVGGSRGMSMTKVVRAAAPFDRRVDAQAWLDEITAGRVTGTYMAPKAGQITVAELHAKSVGTPDHLTATTASTRRYTWPAYVRTPMRYVRQRTCRARL